MKRRRFSEDQIIGYLKEAEAGRPFRALTILDLGTRESPAIEAKRPAE